MPPDSEYTLGFYYRQSTYKKTNKTQMYMDTELLESKGQVMMMVTFKHILNQPVITP